MRNLGLSPHQIALQARALEFAEAVARPRAAEIDASEQYPWDIVKALTRFLELDRAEVHERYRAACGRAVRAPVDVDFDELLERRKRALGPSYRLFYKRPVHLVRGEAAPRRGRVAAGVWRHRRRDGTQVSADITNHALTFMGRPAMFVLADDVTEQIKAEAEAQRSNQMLETVIDNIPQRIFWKDRDSRYLGCNVAFARDAGLSYTEQVIGKTDELGWSIVEDPVHVNDFHATLLHLFGIDHLRLTKRFGGLNLRLTDLGGKVVTKLLA